MSESQTGTKLCKYCAEEIKEQAAICRFCNREQHEELSVPQAAQSTRECPHCAEEILLDAVKCVHCESTLTSPTKLATVATHVRAAAPVTALARAKAPEKRPQPMDTSTRFCTNCGNHVLINAIACTSCGATPKPHNKYCYTCGAALNPAQVICLTCGSTILGTAPTGGKKKLSAGLFALLLGNIGIHKFYLGSWGWGIIYILCAWTFIPCILALVEGVCFLTMNEDRFNEKYNIEEPRPFKW